jgi:predicted component of type VI protein secretion system
MKRAALFVFLLAGCGGSSSETPFPPEPLDVNLEAEDMSTADPYKAARPDQPKKTPATAAPAASAPPAK